MRYKELWFEQTMVQHKSDISLFNMRSLKSSEKEADDIYYKFMKRNKKLIIFDWDGTIMDSISFISQCLVNSFEKLNFESLSEERAKSIIGLGLVDALEALTPGMSQENRSDLLKTYKEFFHANVEGSVQPYSFVHEGLELLSKQNHFLAVATGKSRAGLEKDFDRSGLRKYFHASKTIDDCRSKPDPQMIHDLMNEFNVLPENTVMVGDTTYDMDMAINAGVRRVASAYGAHSEESLLLRNPLFMGNSFEKILHYLAYKL